MNIEEGPQDLLASTGLLLTLDILLLPVNVAYLFTLTTLSLQINLHKVWQPKTWVPQVVFRLIPVLHYDHIPDASFPALF